MNLDKSERMLEHHKEMRDKLEQDLINLKRAENVDKLAVERVQLSIHALNEKIQFHEKKLRRYE